TKCLLRGVAEREAVITAHREGRDTAWQRPPVRGEIHECPGPRAKRPWPPVTGSAKTGPRFGRPRRVKHDAARRRTHFGLTDEAFLGAIETFEQCLLRPGKTLAVGEIDQALQVHFADINAVRKIDERGELGDGFL